MLYLDEDFIEHPKVLFPGRRLGEDGAARVVLVYLAGLRHARKYLTDGFLADDFVGGLSCVRNVSDVVAMMSDPEVVSKPLWRRVDGGYQIHDYRDWNHKAVDIRKMREKDRRRKQAERARRVQAGHSVESEACPEPHNPLSTNHNPSSVGTPVVPPTAVVRGGSAPRAATLVQSPLALRGYAYPNDVVGVPQFCHARFVQRLVNAGAAQPAAEANLRAWYVQVCEQWRGQAIGDTEPAFWDARFEEWQGRTAKASGTTTDVIAARNAAVIRQRPGGSS